jgi:hypothetical protein
MKKRRTLRQVAAGTVLTLLLLAGRAQAQLLFVSVSAAPPAEVLEFAPGGMSSVYSSNLVNPSGLAFNSAGDLFVGGNESSKVYKFTPGGTQSTYANIGSKTLPLSEAFDSAGNLYGVEGMPANEILKISPQGVPSFFAYTGTINDVFDLAFQPIPSVQANYADGTFQLTVTMPSPYYTTIVQASPDLVNWTDICTNTPPFTFTDSTTQRSRFYRAVLDTNFY